MICLFLCGCMNYTILAWECQEKGHVLDVSFYWWVQFNPSVWKQVFVFDKCKATHWVCWTVQRISPSRGIKRKSGSCWDADYVISTLSDACVEHKAGSDRKDFMKLTGCLAGHKVWVCLGQICVVWVLASLCSWGCKCAKGGAGKTEEKLKIYRKPLF